MNNFFRKYSDQGQKRQKVMRLKCFCDASIYNGSLKRVWMSAQNNIAAKATGFKLPKD